MADEEKRERWSGVVKLYKVKKGFGIIKPHHGGEDVFVHYSDIHSDGKRTLHVGQEVEFHIASFVDDQNGKLLMKAIDVTPLGGGKFDNSSRHRSKKGNGDVECYNCGGLGHTDRVCPSVCYTCGCGGDHLSRDCPNRRRRRTLFTSHRFDYSSRQKKIVGTKKTGDHIHNIPLDLCREILILLPPVSLIRFRSVNKAWQSIIDDPSFVKAHNHNQQQKPCILLRNFSGLDTFDLEALIPKNGSQNIPASTLSLANSTLPPMSQLPVATCNGLMLITPPADNKSGQETTWLMWNTLTQEGLELPPSPAQTRRNRWRLPLVGLGYDPSSDDYKVVAIVVHKSLLRPHVYSLKSDTWTTKSDFFCSLWSVDAEDVDRFCEGAFLCGALHWILSDTWQDKDIHMYSFDVGTETLREFKSPPGLRFRGYRQLNLDVLDGCLAVSEYGYDEKSFQHFDIWVMKEYGVEDSWALLYKMPAFYSGSPPQPSLHWLRPVACMKKDKRQILMQDGESFYLFDVEKNTSKKVDIQDCGPATAQVFHGSILRLHDNCGVAAGRRRRRTREKKNTQFLFRLTNFRFDGPTR